MYTTRRRPRRRSVRWLSQHALLIAALALGGILLTTIPITYASSAVWADDDALYGLQVLALREGSWQWEYPGAEFDPDGEFRPLRRGQRVDGRDFPYVRHPMQALVLYVATTVFGLGLGMYVVSMIGLVLAAAAAWSITDELEPRAGPLAFVLVAASPLLVHSYAPWAHTTSAALAGAALLAVVRIVRHGMNASRLAGLVGALGLGVLLRSENVLFAAAVIAVLTVWLAIDARGRGDTDAHVEKRRFFSRLSTTTAGPALAVVACCTAAVAGAVVLESWAVARIVGGDASGLGVSGTLAERNSIGDGSTAQFVRDQLGALWRATFSGSGVSGEASWPIAATIAVGLVAVVGARRLSPSRYAGPLLSAGAVAVVGFYIWRMIRFPTEGVSGLFAAWPAAFIGLFIVPWRRVDLSARVLAGVCLVFAAAVYVTQYPEAGGYGGVDWGGRFLSPAVVAIAALVAAGAARRWREFGSDRGFQQGVAVLAAVLLLMPPVMAVRLLNARNGTYVGVVGAIDSVATPTIAIVSPTPQIALLAELGWRLSADHAVFRTLTRRKALVQALHEAGYDNVTLVFDPRFPPDVDVYSRAQDVTPPGLTGVKVAILHR